MLDSSHQEFDPTRLSDRERAVLDRAAEGHTDTQIALSLALSVSTINSHWVRIRGKLGPYSRTELVSRLNRYEARKRMAELKTENLRLRERLASELERYEELRMESETLGEGRWALTALARLPEAVLVTEPRGIVAFANRQAHRLYRAGMGELANRSMAELTASRDPEGARPPCAALFLPDGPEEQAMGLSEPYYALRRDGSNFRAVLRAERFETPIGPRAVVTVREFMSEAGDAIALLRQPLDLR